MDARTKYSTTAEEGFDYATSSECVAEIDRILNEMRQKSGVAPLNDKPAIVVEECEGEERERSDGTPEVGGGYSPLKNRIRLDPIEYFESGYDVLSTLVHERVHARGFNTFRIVAVHKQRTGEVLEPDAIRMGYENYVTKEFLGFDEGVTELIADEVYRELVKRQGATKFRVGRTKEGKAWYAGYEYLTYENEKAEVKAFMNGFSKKFNVPEGVVWNAVKRGYFEGLDLNEVFGQMAESG